ncbi:hypothetical protein ASPCADRAFT_210826 [Aspergillus carbonarius ITEM 5010]|uniref:Uncharacterized protein n=1 Tax=Aspergillus carbonarius (strain ITEM 5010) TaxID=602072 RepID=A0A1R3RBQ4_ASPC5|nr:hypothetical protein ASPCADRAFT_210826 [Aspergillus carbonarius ITEM 5010]
MTLLKILHVRFGPGRSWHARNVGAVSVEWQRFYRQGWIEKVWETRQIERVLVEAGLEWCDQMDDRERESLRELRGDIQCVPGFEEVSLEWEHSFFLSSACEQFPQTSLCIWLQRSEGLVDGGRERRLGVDEWPEYKPVYTLDDMIFPWVCGFCTEQPPRSPNNSR